MVATIALVESDITLTLPAPLAEDTYELTIRGNGSSVIHDLAGNPFNDGLNDVHRFVVLDLPASAPTTSPNSLPSG